MQGLAIAIDGPVASGKSTVAGLLAKRLNFLYLDTGAMYRTVTWLALSRGISPQDEAGVSELAEKIKLEIKPDREHPLSYRLWADGEELTNLLHSPEVNEAVSLVSEFPRVREVMVKEQQKLSKASRIVVAGRDIGTVVLPDAQVKIFLTADLQERARRRLQELNQKGIAVSFPQVLANVESRDQIDSSRKHSPLKPAPDAVIFDSTGLTVKEVVSELGKLVKEKLGDLL